MIAVTTKADMRNFTRAQRQKVNAILSNRGKIFRDAAGVYMRWMAQMTPPSMGSVELHSVRGNIYERPAMLLPIAIARGGKDAAQDREALRQGKSWKVVVRGKSHYFKSNKRGGMPREIEKLKHIVNRGLARWAFVGALPSAGIAIPVVMRPLAARQRGTDLKKNINYVGSATATIGPKEVRFKMTQTIPFVTGGGWLNIARTRAKAKHHEYLATMLRKLKRA